MAGAMAAVCVFLGALQGSKIYLHQQGNHVNVTAHLMGLSPGEHGFHIHEKGDLGNKCVNAGPHYNPEHVLHGYPDAPVHHRGDLGNILVTDAHLDYSRTFDFFTIEEVLDRAFVVHEKRDDGGQGGDEESTKTGNAGARLDCCVIATSAPSATTASPNAAISRILQQQLWITMATLAATIFVAKTIAS